MWLSAVVAVPIAGAIVLLPLARAWYPTEFGVPFLNLFAVSAGLAVLTILASRAPAQLQESLWASTRGDDTNVGVWLRDFALVLACVAVLLFFNLQLALVIGSSFFLCLTLVLVGVPDKGGKDQAWIAWLTTPIWLTFLTFVVLAFSGTMRTIGIVSLAAFAIMLVSTLFLLQGLRKRDPEYWLPGSLPANAPRT